MTACLRRPCGRHPHWQSTGTPICDTRHPKRLFYRAVKLLSITPVLPVPHCSHNGSQERTHPVDVVVLPDVRVVHAVAHSWTETASWVHGGASQLHPAPGNIQQSSSSSNWITIVVSVIIIIVPVVVVVIVIIIIIIIIMSVLLERFSMWNMLNCAEQVQIQK